MTTKTPQDRREVLLDFVQKYMHVHVHVSFAFAEKDEETKECSYYTYDSFDELLEGLVEHGKMTDAEKHYILYEQLCQDDIEYAADDFGIETQERIANAVGALSEKTD